MLLSKVSACNSKNFKFLTEQEAKGFCKQLRIKKAFKSNFFVRSIFVLKYKMNKIINKFLLAGDKYMPEMHLKQPGFTYSACNPFTKSKERIEKFKETGDSRYIYQNELDKACFQHDMVDGDFKELNRTEKADKVLRDKAFNIAKNLKCDGYQDRLPSKVYKCFDE